MAKPVPIAATDTLKGGLQRGRGWAAKELLGRPAELGDVRLVLDCITHDARWDRQVEARAGYFAELVVRLGVPLEPLAKHVLAVAGDPGRDESDAWLAQHVLERLAEQELEPAERLLEQLPEDDAIAFDGGNRWMLRTTRELVDASLPTAELLAAAGPRNAAEILDVLATRDDEADRAAMLEAALHGPVEVQRVAYLALGRLGDERLVDRAVAMFEAHAADPERAPARSPERFGPQRYLEAMRPELTLPLARRWLALGFPKRVLAARVLIAHAQPDDGPMVLELLREAWRGDDMYPLCSCIDILVTARYWPALDDVLRIDAEVRYSQARRRTTEFLVQAAPELHRARLVDALWDCEDDTILAALPHAAQSSPMPARIAELAASPWHDDDVRASAAKLSSG